MHIIRFLLFGLFEAAQATTVTKADGDGIGRPLLYSPLPPLRAQAELQDAWAEERRESIPRILRKYGVDAWLVSQREYAEETVFWSLKWARQLSSAGHGTMLFLANATGPSSAYNWSNDDDVWAKVRAVLDRERPRSIVVDVDPVIAVSSGLHVGEWQAMREGLGEEWASKFVPEPSVAIEFTATQVKGRAPWYEMLQSNAWAMISEAFSSAVITPGQTTTSDVEWWLREKAQQMNHSTWFHPSVTIITEHDRFVAGSATGMRGPREPKVIRCGDYLHTDFGLTALGMNTDTQHLAYILHPGDTAADVPAGLQNGLRKGNRLQDIVKSNMQIGRTGNEILQASREQMRREGIEGKIYSHPIGDWGHAAGPLIGITWRQDTVPGQGDLRLLPGTYFSIELFVEHFVPERNATLQFPLEEDIRHVGGDDWVWAHGRQETFHVVETTAAELGPGDL